jgi:hypothetical protein
MTSMVLTPKKLANLAKLANCRKKLLVSKRLVQLTRNPVANAGDILQLSYCKRLEISYLYTAGKTGMYFLNPVGNILTVAEGLVYFICTL